MYASTSRTPDNESPELITPFYSQPTDADKKSREVISRFYSQPFEFDPFGYSQDLDAFMKYQEDCLKTGLEAKTPEAKTLDPPTITLNSSTQSNHMPKKRIFKRKSEKPLLQSHIIKKIKHGKRLVKISISNVEENMNDEIMTQYVTQEDTDPLLQATEDLVERIVEKISMGVGKKS